MATPTRYFDVGGIYHIYNRGNRREDIFLHSEDYDYFIVKLFDYAEREDVAILTYCLMQNHFHLLLYQVIDGGIERMMRSLMTSAAKYYNWQYGQVGHLCQERFRSRNIRDASDLVNCAAYVLLNPSKITDYRSYPRSSYDVDLGRSSLRSGFRKFLELAEVSESNFLLYLEYYAMIKMTGQMTSGVIKPSK